MATPCISELSTSPREILVMELGHYEISAATIEALNSSEKQIGRSIRSPETFDVINPGLLGSLESKILDGHIILLSGTEGMGKSATVSLLEQRLEAVDILNARTNQSLPASLSEVSSREIPAIVVDLPKFREAPETYSALLSIAKSGKSGMLLDIPLEDLYNVGEYFSKSQLSFDVEVMRPVTEDAMKTYLADVLQVPRQDKLVAVIENYSGGSLAVAKAILIELAFATKDLPTDEIKKDTSVDAELITDAFTRAAINTASRCSKWEEIRRKVPEYILPYIPTPKLSELI